ncbi:Mitochondrial catalytic protein [Planoprotostelium fungivorum]|uniref:Protein phosphatase n=1 Tax=Planoprotostelium fungivorum TaxID=1890364 RepID=A0A2P6NTZ9_9EUKA|nr:Mitochondrial catalytic protein [Planoprotostelium fungivorum]
MRGIGLLNNIKPSYKIGVTLSAMVVGAALTVKMTPNARAMSTIAKSPVRLLTHSSAVPHPEKAYKGGFFVSDNGLAIGVADGVGGWATQGVDPSKYSKSLMKWAKDKADQPITDNFTPQALMQYAYDKCKGILGSSTACILVLKSEESKLDSANLGDSGFMVIREGRVIYRSMEQVKGFNFPYQLGAGSPDLPKDAFKISTAVQYGDFVVVGSDGLFDNMYNEEILHTLEKGIAQAIGAEEPKQCYTITHGRRPSIENTAPSSTLMSADNLEKIEKAMRSNQFNLAEVIAKQAMQNGHSETLVTPFAKSARENGYRFSGGKLDDVTVLVSMIAPPKVKSSL